MEVVESECDLGRVELGDRIGEALCGTISRPGQGKCATYLAFAKQTEKFSAGDKVHDHVQIVDVLERAPKIDEERVPNSNQHLALRVSMLYLLHLDNLFLSEHLNGVESTVVFRPNEVDSSEGARAESEENELCLNVAGNSRPFDRKVGKGVSACSLS
jgi:hypothetical protein